MARPTTLIFFLFIPLLSCTSYVPFEDCGSVFYLESIEISGCTSYPCHLKIGSSVRVTTNLLIPGINFNTEELEQKVYLVVSKILLEIRVSPDTCRSIQGFEYTSCDIRIGERIAYEAILDVRNVPPLPATLYSTIRNKLTGEQVACYKLSVILTNF